MLYTQDLMEELNILVRYNLETTLEGLKVHQSQASSTAVAATQRLFAKGLVSQEDGGYLTTMGREAAEQAQTVLHLLNPS